MWTCPLSCVFAHMYMHGVQKHTCTYTHAAGETCVVMATHADVNKRGSRVNIVSLLSSRVQFISMEP